MVARTSTEAFFKSRHLQLFGLLCIIYNTIGIFKQTEKRKKMLRKKVLDKKPYTKKGNFMKGLHLIFINNRV